MRLPRLPDGHIDQFRLFFLIANMVIVLGIIQFIYMYYIQGNPPVEFFWEPGVERVFTVDKDEYYPGDTMVYSFTFCKYVSVSPIIYKTWRNTIDSSERGYPAGGADKGECGTAHVPTLVPHLPPGVYTFHIRLVWSVNKIRERTIEHKTEPFEILAKIE